MDDVALIGRARAGKDSVAGVLTSEYSYRRAAFADPLKDLALSADPVITDPDTGEGFRLAYLVDAFGWDVVKDEYPSARRFLQTLGAGVRSLDPEFWLRLALHHVVTNRETGYRTVVTDCRYLNEATALRHLGFTVVRVVRPDQDTSDSHPSETELGDYPADLVITNAGTLSDLRESVRLLMA